MKVMPPPVKKRYSRVHLAYLVMICTLKQSLSISCIQRMLPEEHGEEAARALYSSFVRQYRAAVKFLCSLPFQRGEVVVESGAHLDLEGDAGMVTTAAIFTTLSKSLTESLLQEGCGGEPEDDDDDEE